MKTTIEIADDLFERAQRVARKEKTTFRSLAEQGLRLVLKEKQQGKAKQTIHPALKKQAKCGEGIQHETNHARNVGP